MRQDREVIFAEIEWVLRDSEYTPGTLATSVDPEESAELSYDAITLKGSTIDLQGVLDNDVILSIEEAAIKNIEGV